MGRERDCVAPGRVNLRTRVGGGVYIDCGGAGCHYCAGKGHYGRTGSKKAGAH